MGELIVQANTNTHTHTHTHIYIYIHTHTHIFVLHAVVPLVEALRYRPEGRRFIPDNVIRIFHWHKPSGHIIAMGSTPVPTEMSTRNISWGVNVASAWGWQPYNLHVPTVLKSGSLNLLELPGPVQALQRLIYHYILHTHTHSNTTILHSHILCFLQFNALFVWSWPNAHENSFSQIWHQF